MPITLSDINTGTPEYGIGSFLMFADRVRGIPSNDDTMDIAGYHQRKYIFSSAEIMANAPTIEIPVINDTPYEFPRQQGPLDIINGFSTPAFVDNMEVLYRQVMNDSRQLNPANATASDTTQIGYREAQGSADAIVDGESLTTTPKMSSAFSGYTAPIEPMRLMFTPGSTSTATVTIVGTDYNDSVIRESVTFAGTAPQITTRYFKTITSLAATAGVTVDVGQSSTADHRRYTSTFQNNTDAKLLHGMDVYVEKGNVPNTFREVFIDGMSFSISRTGDITYAWNCIGRRPSSHRSPSGGTTKPDTTSIPAISKIAFTGWQAGIFYTAPGENTPRRLAGVEANITVSNNLEFSPVLSGIRTPGRPFRRRLNFTFDGTMQYKSNDTELISDVLGNDYLDNAYLEMVNASTGGFPYRVRFRFSRLQFTNVPDAEVTDEGEIYRRMEMIALPSADGTVPAVRIETHTLTPTTLAAITTA